MDRGILVSGLGWITAGIVCFLTWYAKSIYGYTCSCPNVPAGDVAIGCCHESYGLIAIGIFVIIVGIALIAENEQVAKLTKKMLRKQRGVRP